MPSGNKRPGETMGEPVRPAPGTDSQATGTFAARSVALAGGLVLLVMVRLAVAPEGALRSPPDASGVWPTVENLLESGASPFSPTDLASLPGVIGDHELAPVLTIWPIAALVGGGSVIVTIYPLAGAVLIAVMVYLFARWLTDDSRVALLAVVLLALTPAHAIRTSLGGSVLDAFGYLSVMTTATALVWLVRADATGRSLIHPGYVVATIAAGIGIVATVFGSRAGPLLLAPIALVAVIVPLCCTRNERSPLAETRGVLCALTVATAIGAVLHLWAGWGQPYRALAPLVLLQLAVALVALVDGVDRLRLPWPTVVGSVMLVASGWLGAMAVGESRFVEPMRAAWAGTTGTSATATVVQQSAGAATPDLTLVSFGVLVAGAFPVMLWILVAGVDGPRGPWLLASSYAWVLLGLALLDHRWIGLAAMFVVVFGAVGLLSVAARLHLIGPVSVFSSAGSRAESG